MRPPPGRRLLPAVAAPPLAAISARRAADSLAARLRARARIAAERSAADTPAHRALPRATANSFAKSGWSIERDTDVMRPGLERDATILRAGGRIRPQRPNSLKTVRQDALGIAPARARDIDHLPKRSITGGRRGDCFARANRRIASPDHPARITPDTRQIHTEGGTGRHARHAHITLISRTRSNEHEST